MNDKDWSTLEQIMLLLATIACICLVTYGVFFLEH